jgi:enoyl-CoA hydratase/carnithine racemase
MSLKQTTIQLERQGAVALVQLAGERLHLLSMARLQALDEVLMEPMTDQSVRAVVLHGAGGLFSAGADLKAMARFDAQAATAFIGALHGTCQHILLAPKPIIAAIAGPCLGGALEMALCCDGRLASLEARLGMPEVAVGIPSVIEAMLLPQVVGLGRARRLLLTAQIIGAPEALAMGLVDMVVPQEKLLDAAMQEAAHLAALPPGALAAQKALIAHWVLREEAIAHSMQLFAKTFAHGAQSEARQAIAAFLNRNKQAAVQPLSPQP